MGDLMEPPRVMNREGILSSFCELEEKYKTDGDPESLCNVLGIFQITKKEDLVPENIYKIYKDDWAKYCEMRKSWDRLGDDDDANSEEDLVDIQKRFSSFQETIFYAQQTMLSFMRMTNCNSAFPTPDTPDMLFWHTPMDKGEGMKPIHLLTIYMLGSLFQGRYRRVDGLVMEQIFTENGHPTHAWKEKCTIKDMVRSMCDKESKFEMWKILTNGLFDQAVRYLTECRDIEFPDLVIKRRVWSFSDGIYDATNDEFWFYGKHTDENLVSCKIIDKPFAGAYFKGEIQVSGCPRNNYEDLSTPLFDSIFSPQNWDHMMIKWMFAFIGRLFYKVNEKDSWQVIPFLKGVAGTGKSTVIKVIQMMYNARDIGVISNNIEKKFGLSSIFDKTIFIIPELKGDFQMDQAEFQSMVTGEELSLGKKHEAPTVGQWVVPGIIAGNESARWEDKAGSICRRIVVMDFPNKIPQEKSNPNLLNNIKNSEIPTIIRKATLAYNWAVETYGNDDIWTALPSRILEEKRKLQYSTNPLYAFMNSDRVDIDAEEYTLESLFIVQLKAFAALKFPGVNITFTEDFYSYIFSDYNIRVEHASKNWPRHSNNLQSQTYVCGCTVNI